MRLLTLLLLIPALCPADWEAGVAATSITPREPVWMSGYGNRTEPARGTAMPLQAKALALKDASGGRVVAVTSDLIGFSRASAERIADRARERYGVERSRLLLNSSHTHTGPAINENLPLMQPPTADLQAATDRFTRYLEDQIVEVIGAALDDLAPAELSYHVGAATFSQNRRQIRGGAVLLGDNPSGLTDHSVPVLKVTGPDGALRAALFSYVSHNTTLTGQHMEFHGDYAGAAQEVLEREHPGAVALFALGCAGDQNPRERGTIEIAEKHGLELAAAVDIAMTAPGTALSGRLSSHFERFPIHLQTPPDRSEWILRARDLEGPDQRLAQYYLRKGSTPSSYEYPIQVLGLGDQVTLIALGGEVTVEYALQLKQRLGEDSTWVIAYSNDVMSYIPTAKILAEGGYEAERSQAWYGMPSKWRPSIEETILTHVVAAARALRP